MGKSRIVTTQWPQLHISQCAAWGPGVDARLLKGLNDRLKAAGYAIRDGVEIPSDLIVMIWGNVENIRMFTDLEPQLQAMGLNTEGQQWERAEKVLFLLVLFLRSQNFAKSSSSVKTESSFAHGPANVISAP